MNRKRFQALIGGLMLLSWGAIGVWGIPTSRLDDLVNYPNPFDSRRTSTTIFYRLPQQARVVVRILDLFGTPVREWTFSAGAPGAQEGVNRVEWDGTNESGQKVASGGYLCQVLAEQDNGFAQGVRKVGVVH